MPGQASHGKKTSFKLDNSGGALTDISNQCTNVDLAEDAEVLETTAFQDTDKTFLVGFKDNKVTFQGRWGATIDAHLGAVLGQDATISFEIGPEGSGTGKVKYTGEAILTKFQKTGAVNAVNSFSGELQVSGPVTRGTFA
jgi:hypothetical protein